MSETCRIILPALAAFAVLVAGHAAAEDRIDLPSRPGVTQPILFTPAAAPVASAVLFPGGAGVIASEPTNFLLRVRGQFAAQNISVAVIDVPSDHATASNGFRASAEHAKDIAAVIAFLKQKAAVPVWLIGTSRGSVSAANGAVRIGPPRVSGLVLTSAAWNGGMQRVPLQPIAVPALVVHNRDDACPKCPFAGGEAAMAELVNAPVKQFATASGGTERGQPCGSLSAHGYYGVEDQVVPVIIAWIKDHSRPAR